MLLRTDTGGFTLGDAEMDGTAGFGAITEGQVATMAKRAAKLRADVFKARDSLGRAQFKLGDAVKLKNKRKWGKVVRERTATLRANEAQYAAALKDYNEAKAELASQSAEETAATSGGGGDEAPAEESAPEPSTEPATDGLGVLFEEGGKMVGLGDEDAASLGGLFSGAGEPKYLPLGKVGTPLALLGAWYFGRKLLKKRRR